MEFYKTFNEIKDNKYDGLIVTGAPVEKLKFEDVDYWDELQRFLIGPIQMSFLHSLFVGLLKHLYIIIMVLKNIN